MILHEAQAQHLLSHRRQTETLQTHEASGNLRVEQSGRTQTHLTQIRQILQTIVQQPHVLNTGLQHRQIRQRMGVNQERANVLAADLNQIRVRAVTEPLRALHVQRNRRRTLCQRACGLLEAFSGINDGRGPPTWLSDKLRVIRIALRQATAIVYQHSNSFEVTGRNDAGRLAHGVRPPE